jgi:cell wall-associated NlpC family hydrolase
MKRDDIVNRARSAIGHGTLYRLGAGAPASAPGPWDETGSCDCSGFACWVLGLSRFQPILGFLKPLNGGWLNTDGMVCDALSPTGFFEQVAGAPLPGDLVVYPSWWYAKQIYRAHRPFGPNRPRIGHVGIVSGDQRVIHCSARNYNKYDDAISETDFTSFLSVAYFRYIRFCGAE